MLWKKANSFVVMEKPSISATALLLITLTTVTKQWQLVINRTSELPNCNRTVTVTEPNQQKPVTEHH